MRRALALLPLLVLAACSASGGASDGDASVGGDPNLLTQFEIEAFAETGAGQTAYDLVVQRRRQWLTSRALGNDDGQTLSVYDGPNRLGDADALRRLDLAAVGRLEYLEPRIARNRYGVMAPVARGAIVVTFR